MAIAMVTDMAMAIIDTAWGMAGTIHPYQAMLLH